MGAHPERIWSITWQPGSTGNERPDMEISLELSFWSLWPSIAILSLFFFSLRLLDILCFLSYSFRPFPNPSWAFLQLLRAPGSANLASHLAPGSILLSCYCTCCSLDLKCPPFFSYLKPPTHPSRPRSKVGCSRKLSLVPPGSIHYLLFHHSFLSVFMV